MEFRELIDQLYEHRYTIIPNWLDGNEADGLIREFELLRARGAFKPAGIGKNADRAGSIRRDEISWFEPGALLPAQASLWNKFERLRERLNAELLLGLWNLEGHFAAYEPGAFYKRHLDRFANDDARTVTLVLYLNEDWHPRDGGELVIHTPGPSDSKMITVEPHAGTLVVFMSDQIEHEVLETKAPRRSFAGWYRRRTL